MLGSLQSCITNIYATIRPVTNIIHALFAAALAIPVKSNELETSARIKNKNGL